MKLNEIIDTNIQTHNVPNYTDDVEANRYDRLERGKQPGEGHYSKVEPKEDDPHMVTKTSYDPHKELELKDGYFYYINEIYKTKVAQGNPCFPRVYEINVYRDSTGAAKFKADIEKLEEAISASEEEILALGKRMFLHFDQSHELNMANSLTFRNTKNTSNKTKYLDSIANELYKSTYNPASYIRDENLVEAMKFISKLEKQNKKVDLDLHSENFMFRRGKNGIQLVITDPFRNYT
jgi:hypothetical protein